MTRPATNQDVRYCTIIGMTLMTVLVIFLAYQLNSRFDEQGTTVKVCAEDDVIVGVGDFSNGTWTGYRCENREEVN